MHLVLRYPDGRRIDGLLLYADANHLRVTTHERADTVEVFFVLDQWMDDKGQRIIIEAIIDGGYHAGRQTNTKYSETSVAANTAPAAIRSMTAGRIN
jgi:hypothetical protein